MSLCFFMMIFVILRLVGLEIIVVYIGLRMVVGWFYLCILNLLIFIGGEVINFFEECLFEFFIWIFEKIVFWVMEGFWKKIRCKNEDLVGYIWNWI